jgi:MipA family protein
MRHPLTIALITALLWSLCSLAAADCQAQTLDEDELQQQGLMPPSREKWKVTLGVGAAAEPNYLGSSHYRAAPIPLVSVAYDDLLFVGPQGIGVNVVSWHGLRAGPVLGMEYGRPESRDQHLRGVGDISPSLAGGGFISYSAGPYSLVGSLRQAITHSDHGLVGRVAFNYKRVIDQGRFIVAAGPEIDLVNGAYANTWFGVSEEQSARSGLPVYHAHGGVRDVGVNGSVTYRCSKHIMLRSFVDLRELVGSIQDSPIVQRRTQFLAGAGVAYHF